MVEAASLPDFMEGRYDMYERNTFLDFPAPLPPLPLEKAQTDPPPGLEGLCGIRSGKFISETEHSEDSTAADEADAPPPLPLEVFVTPDCFEEIDLGLPKPLSATAPAFIPCPLHGVDLPISSPSMLGMEEPQFPEPRARKQISLEEMLAVPSSPPLVPMPVAGAAPKWLPAPPSMPAPVLAEVPAPEVPAAVAVAGPSSLEGELQPGQLFCKASGEGSWNVHWTLDSKQLYNTTVRLVSSTFSLDVEGVGPMPFKALLQPKAEHAERYPKMHVAFRVGRGSLLPARVIEAHDFAEQSCCCLPEQQQEWDFRSLVDEPTGALLVSMRIEAASASP
ncbi:unnamed protein product [Effrenium voratum]|uniref:Uncharacterized protein n=1 Tax=Effrenium voratum TaxID=2562239 RepID=A0AA36IQZ2_9DINO|nr:unnamed protein product [Effrenium voratum]